MNKQTQGAFPLHCLHSLIAANTRGGEDLYEAIESAIDFSLQTGDTPEPKTKTLKLNQPKSLKMKQTKHEKN